MYLSCDQSSNHLLRNVVHHNHLISTSVTVTHGKCRYRFVFQFVALTNQPFKHIFVSLIILFGFAPLLPAMISLIFSLAEVGGTRISSSLFPSDSVS